MKEVAPQTFAYPAERLAILLSEAGLAPLGSESLAKFELYLRLILRWNASTNLTAVRDEGEILRRHFIESIACANALPQGIVTLLDFGSGGGFPGIPVAICRPDIAVTLAESQNKKAAFLRVAVSGLGLSARVFGGRAETLSEEFDCVTMRAVDRMEIAVQQAASLVRPGGLLAVMTTRAEFIGFERMLLEFGWAPEILLPRSAQRVVRLGTKRARADVPRGTC